MTDRAILEEAKRILESEAFQLAVKNTERYFIEMAASAGVNDTDQIIEGMRHVRALRAVISGLEAWAMTGKIQSDKAEKAKNGETPHVA